MAGEPLTTAAPDHRGWAAAPAAVRVAVIYLAARLVTTAFLIAVAAIASPASRIGANGSIGSVALAWDAQWYWFVALNGYPTELPLTDAGAVAENGWAFMPLYAYLAALVGAPFGAWGVGAVIVSLVAGYLACLVLYRLLRERQDTATATWAVVFFAAGPLAALFQVGYAESLFLLWLFLALWCVARRRFAWLYLLIPLMGYTRPGVLAFALFLGLYGIARFVTRSRDPLRAVEVVHIVALGALATVVGFSWQVIAGIATGDMGAYLATELAWRRNWIGDAGAHFIPFEGFVLAAGFWFGQWGMPAVVGYITLALAVLGVAALLLFEPHVKRLGVEIRLWIASYLVYLLAVFFPQSSIFRLLVPLAPAWGAAAMPRSTLWRGGVLVACLIGQWFWILNMYGLEQTFWRIP